MATMGFLRRDFEVFAIEDFSARLAKIDELVTPRLMRLEQRTGNREFSRNLHMELYPHIAQTRAARGDLRETWAAFGPSRSRLQARRHLALCVSSVGIHARAVVKSDADNRAEIARSDQGEVG